MRGRSETMKAIYIPVGATGHVLSSLPMVGELVKRGVAVTYFAPERYHALVKETGASFSPIPAVASKGGSIAAGADFLAGLPLVFLEEAKEVIDAILPVAQREQPDIVIADEMALAGRLVCAKLHLPLAMVFTSFAPCGAFSICRQWPVYPDTHPAREMAHRLADRLTELYGVPHLDLYEIFEGTGDINISTLTRDFQPAGDSFGSDFVFAGAQIAHRAGDPVFTPPDNGRPLLYTSLGSLFNNWRAFYSMLFPVVRDMELNVLCAIGPTLTPDDLGDIPANVTLLPFAPQLDVLAHADYFITHAGTGSAMEALHFGVPCLCVPQMDEQKLTASRLISLGAASASLERAAMTESALRSALTELIANPRYARRARAISREMQKENGREIAARAIIGFMHSR